jgi:hypothetical protein
MTKIKNDASGMRGQRSRNQDGQLRKKRNDTFASTIEQNYNLDFGVRGNMHLKTLLKKTEKDSLNDLVSSGLGNNSNL